MGSGLQGLAQELRDGCDRMVGADVGGDAVQRGPGAGAVAGTPGRKGGETGGLGPDLLGCVFGDVLPQRQPLCCVMGADLPGEVEEQARIHLKVDQQAGGIAEIEALMIDLVLLDDRVAVAALEFPCGLIAAVSSPGQLFFDQIAVAN